MFGSIKNQLRSVIEWVNPDPQIIFEKWSSDTNEIKNCSKLIVGPGQGCIFVYQGRVQATYAQSGVVELKTANIPFWTTVTKFMQAFESEHKAGLYFYKQSQLLDIKWGTTAAVRYEDPKYKFPVGLRAFGNFSIMIEKPEWFFVNILGQRDTFSILEIRELVVSRILQNLTDYLATCKHSYAEVDSNRNEIAADVSVHVNAEYEKLGLRLIDFRVEGTSFDEDTSKRINRIADMSAEAQAAQSAGLTYAQLQQLEALKEAAKNPGGPGMMMGIGLGANLGQQIIATSVQSQANQTSTQSNPADSSGDYAVRLKKIKELLDQGLINQAEFDAKKKDILASI
jgi:membrane protease subunit (stomatin/prohibitin family)